MQFGSGNIQSVKTHAIWIWKHTECKKHMQYVDIQHEDAHIMETHCMMTHSVWRQSMKTCNIEIHSMKIQYHTISRHII